MDLPDNIISLVQKYNKPGPRYTSYPTAPHFSETCDQSVLVEEFKKQSKPASLYVHIPFCESNCWFCGCNTIITTRRKSADKYLDYLEKEISVLNQDALAPRVISQIHLGGGTPNFLSPDQIHRLFEILGQGFDIRSDKELSVELAPNYLTASHLEAFAAHGLSRASFGVQDVDPQVQRAINRIQSQEENRNTMGLLRQLGVQSVNIDLIYGLPYQTMESYQHTLEAIFELNPDRLAVFNYAHVPHMKPYQKKLERHPLPSPSLKIDLLLSIIQRLEQGGYHYVGMDHFAKSDDELHLAQREKRLHRNFQGYTIQEDEELIALGVSSISETPFSYRQNVKTIADYQSLLDQGEWPVSRGLVLSQEDFGRRLMIQSVMCNLHFHHQDFESEYSDLLKEVKDHLEHVLPEFEQDGLVQIHSNGFDVTDLGRLFLRNIAMLFDAYLGVGNAKFSRTV